MILCDGILMLSFEYKKRRSFDLLFFIYDIFNSIPDLHLSILFLLRILKKPGFQLKEKGQ